MKASLKPLMTSDNPGWETPDVVLDLVRQLGPIVLDPATTVDNPTGAQLFYTSAEDGLAQTWDRGGLVYLNPPYGRGIGDWAAKCAAHGSMGSVEIVALLPARTDARWWQKYVTSADAFCFWAGRLRFKGGQVRGPVPVRAGLLGPTGRRILPRFRGCRVGS